MRFSPHFRMSVTKRGEKEQRLVAFISRNLAAAGRGATPPWQSERISVIARSVQSPVVKALGALAADVAAAGCSVRVILARSDPFPPTEDSSRHPVLGNCDVRLARDPRLAEAHEQLVLGPGACWTGDSMRRDPAACDAYESFIDDCAELASAAASTFERLWTCAGPLFEHRPTPMAIGLAAMVERRP